MGVPPQGEAADCKSVAEKHVGFDSLHSHQTWPHRLRWLGHRPFKAEKRDRHPLGLPYNGDEDGKKVFSVLGH